MCIRRVSTLSLPGSTSLLSFFGTYLHSQPSRQLVRELTTYTNEAAGTWNYVPAEYYASADSIECPRSSFTNILTSDEVCIRAVLNLRKDSSSASPECQTVGVVPCAIGGASLDEWQKSFQGGMPLVGAYRHKTSLCSRL